MYDLLLNVDVPSMTPELSGWLWKYCSRGTDITGQPTNTRSRDIPNLWNKSSHLCCDGCSQPYLEYSIGHYLNHIHLCTYQISSLTWWQEYWIHRTIYQSWTIVHLQLDLMDDIKVMHLVLYKTHSNTNINTLKKRRTCRRGRYKDTVKRLTKQT